MSGVNDVRNSFRNELNVGAKFVGKPVSAGQNVALGSSCQWAANDGTGDVLVQVTPSDCHERPQRSRGYKDLTDLGTQGVRIDILRWLAGGVIVGKGSIRMSVGGAAASEATAIAMLRETLKRRAARR